MRFCVSVPVLSTHRTVAAPSASMAGMRRVSTFVRAIRHAPNARNTVNTMGNSSGMSAIARLMPAQEAIDDAAASHPVGNEHQHAQGNRDGSQQFDHATRLVLQSRPLDADRLECRADATHLRAWTSRKHMSKPLAARDQRSRIHVGLVVAARSRACDLWRWPVGEVSGALSYWDGFAREEGLVGCQVGAPRQDGIGGHAIALAQHNPVTADDVTPRDPPPLSITDDECARARQIAQRLQRTLSLPFLIQLDADDKADRTEQEHSFRMVPENDVHEPSSQEQEDHWLAQHVDGRL